MRKYHLFIILLLIVGVLFFANSSESALVGTTNQATLSLSPEAGSYNVNDTFSISIYLNTGGQNVVVASAHISYDKSHFEAVSIDTTGSVFTMEAEKVIDSANGFIKITRGIPTPGVRTSNGLVAKINFRALCATAPNFDNLVFNFSAGATDESNVILDDGRGTDILTGVYNGRYTISGMGSCATGPTIPEGGLIRAKGDIDVYIVKYIGAKKFKRLILSPSVFNNYRHLKWSAIQDVDKSVIDSFTTSDLVRADGDYKVYKLYPAGDTGQRSWIKTAEAFLRMGFDWDAVYTINQFDRDSYLEGSSIE